MALERRTYTEPSLQAESVKCGVRASHMTQARNGGDE